MRSIVVGPRILDGRFVRAGTMGKPRRGPCLRWSSDAAAASHRPLPGTVRNGTNKPPDADASGIPEGAAAVVRSEKNRDLPDDTARADGVREGREPTAATSARGTAGADRPTRR